MGNVILKTNIKTDKFKEILVKNNLTVKELAKKTGTSSSFISQIINNKRRPSPKVRQSIMSMPIFKKFKFEDLFEIED